MKTNYIAGMLALTLVSCATQQTSTQFEPDQRWVTATLANGLTYHLYPDSHQEVSIRLYVHAGSFQEKIKQAGYAHFIEHMAFNGSLHYEHNAVIDMVEQSGAQFGADLNAYTNFSQTVYQLDLPDNTHVNDALLWMRDIADGLSFDAQEVEKEKGVILGEFRFRRAEPDTLYEHFTSDTDYLSYDPLGNRSNIQMASADALREFYQAWYQPQLAELVITGDVTLEQGEKLVRQYFSDWHRGETPRPARPAPSKQNTSDLVYTVNAGSAPRLSLFYPQGENRIADHESQLEYRLDLIANQLIENRLQNAFFNTAQATQELAALNYEVEDQRYTELTVAFPMQQRAKAQNLFLTTLASLRDHGVTQQELDMALKSYREELDNLDWYASQQTPNVHADDRIFAISYDEVLPSALDYKSGLQNLLATATLARVNQHLTALLATDPMFEIAATDKEDLNTLTYSLSDLRQTLQQPGQTARFSQVDTPFLPPAAPGDIVRSQTFTANPNLTQWTLSNGVEVYYLRSANAGDDVYLRYASIGGASALPSELLPASQLAVMVAGRSGLGNLSNVQLNNYLKEHNIAFTPYIDSTSHGVELSVNKSQMGSLFELLNQMTREIHVDANQLASAKSELAQATEQNKTSPTGQLLYEVSHGSYVEGSKHWIFSAQDYQRVTPEQIFQVHHELFQKQRNNTLVIVANVSPTELQTLLRQYVANLTFDVGTPPDLNVHYRQSLQPRIELPINTHDSAVYFVRMIAPARATEAKTVFMDDLLLRIVDKRLTATVRESQSLDYSPFAVVLNSDSENSVDWLMTASVETSDAAKVEKVFDGVVQGLAQGITPEETAIAAKQLQVDLNNMQKNAAGMAWFLNRYVINDFGLDAALNTEATTNSISADDLTRRAQQIFGSSAIKQKVLMTPKPDAS